MAGDDLRSRLRTYIDNLVSGAREFKHEDDREFAALVIEDLNSLLARDEEKQPLVARYRVNQDNTVTPVAQRELGRITITRAIDEDGDDLIDLRQDGDAEHYLIALGMLEAAKDWINHPPVDEDDES